MFACCRLKESYRPRRPDETVRYKVLAGIWRRSSHAGSRMADTSRFVERELRKFLECGIPAHGFLRLRCDGCGKDKLVSYSCKGRGFCPSCCGRRMVDTAAHLVDRVIPHVPVRQWVLSLPYALRYRLAYDVGMVTFKRALSDTDLRFIIVGAYAVNLHGDPLSMTSEIPRTIEFTIASEAQS